ncbi:TlpA family protein disulfide reductase [Evansella tamaricis]|uniref:TlpA family protein disulfide reductase n=1 Tax=Evansella tamaricis TaxID=2069301 RepID=A0ABS6JII0_9BACI|nr:TlpA disulfide reductase family protein [Evansella tamaricis]MBU9712265.1 TlpA family protein disulfide reductase [Evansella tamaricis]
MIHMKRTMIILLILSVGIFIWMDQEQRKLYQYGNSKVETASLPQVGFQAPDFSLHTLSNGTEKQLSNIIHEKEGTILYFWTTWCPFCAASMEALETGNEKYGGNITFIGINVTNQDTKAAAESFVADHGISFENMMDSNGVVSNTYFVPPVPTTIFINQEGIITYRKVGGITVRDIEQGIQQLERSNH